jgi:signal transduction histidine kinase
VTTNASIQRTLALGLSASVAVVALVLGLVALLLSENTVRDYARAGLDDDAVSVLAALERRGEALALDSTALLPSYQTPLSGRYFTVDAAGQHFRSRSLWDTELSMPQQAGLVPGFSTGPNGQQLLVLRREFRRLGTDVVIVVATDMAPLLTRFRNIGMVLLGLTVCALLLLLLMQRYWMRHALAPLKRTQQQLLELQQGRRELLQTDAPLELTPLINEINHLLQYSRESMKRSRHALGNLGHALKSPLGVLFVLADKADDDLKPQLRAQLEHIQRRVSRELGRARASGEALFGTAFTPHEDLPLLIDTLRRSRQRELQITWTAPQGQLPFEQDDMLELLGNLLDNACKWARNCIDVKLSIDSGALVLQVDDDGPGVAPELRETLLARGTRLDESVEGHGLGLGIVSDLVAVYHGTLSFDTAEPGGLRVCVRLPLPYGSRRA